MTLTPWTYTFNVMTKYSLWAIPTLTYVFYYKKSEEIRGDKFKNKSKLFGGLKNPQY